MCCVTLIGEFLLREYWYISLYKQKERGFLANKKLMVLRGM